MCAGGGGGGVVWWGGQQQCRCTHTGRGGVSVCRGGGGEGRTIGEWDGQGHPHWEGHKVAKGRMPPQPLSSPAPAFMTPPPCPPLLLSRAKERDAAVAREAEGGGGEGDAAAAFMDMGKLNTARVRKAIDPKILEVKRRVRQVRKYRADGGEGGGSHVPLHTPFLHYRPPPGTSVTQA